jgi:hypothetical protein
MNITKSLLLLGMAGVDSTGDWASASGDTSRAGWLS